MTDAYALAQLSELNDAWKRWVPPNGSEAYQNIIALDMAIQALQEREERKTPCDLCAHNPPSRGCGMRLIDGDSLIDKLKTSIIWNVNINGLSVMGDALFDVIKTAPIIDAVPVVRCKDCKFARHYDNTAGAVDCEHPKYRFIYGDTWDWEFNPVVGGDHFCSYGVRRADDGSD